MRYRLRVLEHDYHLADGQYALGRNASCQIILDDSLVSRRHALITIDGDEASIEDLHSRNGVLHNGVKIHGPTRLRAGDVLTIGTHRLQLLDQQEGGTLVRRNAPANQATMPRLGTEREGEAPQLASPRDGSALAQVERLRSLGDIADKALALGRSGEAEQVLASSLADILEAARSGRALSPMVFDEAARYAARLATATSKGGWSDYIIELYLLQRRPPPSPVIDELYIGMRRAANVDWELLRQLIVELQQHSSAFGPAERMLLQRLEGLERSLPPH